MHAVLAHQAGDLRDDASTMLVERQGSGVQRITPDASAEDRSAGSLAIARESAPSAGTDPRARRQGWWHRSWPAPG
jgi:hypothetical protein